MERRLAAILAADVVGYSRLMEADEDATARTLNTYREIIEGLVASHHGRVFGSAGDSVIAEFASPVEAVRCAIAIQQDVEDRNAGLPENHRMRFRIGVNLGDVMIDGQNLLGDGVNIAARLEALAGPAEVYISRPVFDQVRKQLPFGYEDLGERQVKNLAEPIAVYRVSPQKHRAKRRPFKPRPLPNRWRWGAVAAAMLLLFASTGAWWTMSNDTVSDRGKFRLPDRPSIAVMPFDPFGDGEEQRFLAEGIAEDIITELARNSELTVMARSATFALKDRGLSAREIASELEVHYVLAGSVRRAGDELRITAQLVDGQTGNHVWAERYNAAATEIYEM